jgi:hypothetical protein
MKERLFEYEVWKVRAKAGSKQRGVIYRSSARQEKIIKD